MWARVWVDSGAGQPLPDGHELAELRKEVDHRVLANLLRLNLARSGADHDWQPKKGRRSPREQTRG